MADSVARTIKRLGIFDRSRLQRRHRDDRAGVGLGRVDEERLLAYRHRLAAHQSVAVVVFNLSPWTPINHRLIAVPARTLLALHRANGNRPKFDSLHGTPRLCVALEDLDSMKAGLLECGQERALFHRSGYASAPQFRVVAQMGGNRLITDDV